MYNFADGKTLGGGEGSVIKGVLTLPERLKGEYLPPLSSLLVFLPSLGKTREFSYFTRERGKRNSMEKKRQEKREEGANLSGGRIRTPR